MSRDSGSTMPRSRRARRTGRPAAPVHPRWPRRPAARFPAPAPPGSPTGRGRLPPGRRRQPAPSRRRTRSSERISSPRAEGRGEGGSISTARRPAPGGEAAGPGRSRRRPRRHRAPTGSVAADSSNEAASSLCSSIVVRRYPSGAARGSPAAPVVGDRPRAVGDRLGERIPRSSPVAAVSWISRTGGPSPRSAPRDLDPAGLEDGPSDLDVSPDPADQREGDRPGTVLSGEGGRAVERAGNDHAAVALGAVDGVPGDLLGRHPDGARVFDPRHRRCRRPR